MSNPKEISILPSSTGDNFDELIACRNYQTLRLFIDPFAIPHGPIYVFAPKQKFQNQQNYPTIRYNPDYKLHLLENHTFTDDEIFGLSTAIARDQFRKFTGINGRPNIIGTFFPNGFTFNKGDLYPKFLANGCMSFDHSAIAKRFNTPFSKNGSRIETTSLDGITIFNEPDVNIHELSRNGFEELSSRHGSEIRITIVHGSDQFGHVVVTSPDEIKSALNKIGNPNQIILIPNLRQPVSLGVSEDIIRGRLISSLYSEIEITREPDNFDPIARTKYGGADLYYSRLGTSAETVESLTDKDQITGHHIKAPALQGSEGIKIFRDLGIEMSIAMGVMVGYNANGDRISGVTDPTTRIRGLSPLVALLDYYFTTNNDRIDYTGSGGLRLTYSHPDISHPTDPESKARVIDKIQKLGYSFGMYHKKLIIITGLNPNTSRTDYSECIENHRLLIRNQKI